ncbi:hypothetical protein [Glutamicibacter sp. X7]
MNVWEMSYDMWLLYVRHAEKWSEEQKKARESKKGRGRGRRRR